eukprot:TRINITY_DN18383_c0_g1_i2.p1 TRINITY_DN18383_c0_g1~~TRINITY_DN18383_c0_g1_i2.p1  ORF type:complete len:332 (+),score=70.17 TRINITY_DN18383_c0_g1_i2:572-1567(+)
MRRKLQMSRISCSVILTRKRYNNVDVSKRIGLRINPVTGSGSIESVSTAGRGSKFGLPLTEETHDRLVDIYRRHRWLQGVHIHVGSQGMPLEKLAQGARTIMAFVKDIEAACGDGAIRVVDIGGGLPTSYTEEFEAFGFSEYRRVLEEAAPELFSGRYQVMTEFGRCVVTKPGITLSRIAAVKGAPWHPDTPILVAHVGSNQFLREAYLGDTWRHRFTALGQDGSPLKHADDFRSYDIAGPLCFQGDFLGKRQFLPASLSAGDLLVMHDTGGYTMAMYSKYNSRQASAIYGYRRDMWKDVEDNFNFVTLKNRESYEEALSFWGEAEPPSVR